ncbi:MAG: TolC family protein, partial [Deltaproteobacteria bacterium]|nr:TolC family protein [Deltaproteobacteria bacterium]
MGGSVRRILGPAAAALALLVSVPGPVRGQEPPDGASRAGGSGEGDAPPVEDLVREALARSPSVAAVRARVEAARQMVDPAGAPPDPMLEVMYRNVGAPWDPMRPMTMGEVQYTQPLPWPGKRGSRRAAASAEAEMRVAEGDDVRRTLVMQVRSAYARVYVVDRELESLAAARELLAVLSAVAQDPLRHGQGEQEAIVKAQIESSRLEERATDLDAQRAALVAVVNRLLDRPAGSSLGRVAALPVPEAPEAPEDVRKHAIGRSPEIAMRSATVRAAGERLAAARLESRPNFLVGIGGGSTLDPAAVVTLRLGLELPIWNRQRAEPMVAQARADLTAAEEDLRAAEARARTDAERLVAQWRRDQAQIVRYREAIVPQSAVAIDAARASS